MSLIILQGIYRHNNIMSFLRSGAASPRVMDKLEQQYNEQAQYNLLDHKRKQNLYYKIVQMQQASMNQRKSMEKELKNKEDDKIKSYWKAQEDRYREMQRRKKEEVDNVRKVNVNLSLDIQHQSKIKDQFVPYSDQGQFYAQQAQKQKKFKEEFYRDAEEYEQIRKQKQRNEKLVDMEVAHLKYQQRAQIERKRQADLRRIREKHQQNYAAYHNLQQKLRQRQAEQQMLESYIIHQGANDQQQKMLEARAQFQAKQKRRKQNYMNDLKNQLETDTYRHVTDRKIQIQNDRNLIDQRNRYFSEMEKINRMRKSDEDKKVLEVLKSQVKPRKLLADPEVPEKVGLGSPVNIGKVVGDDRKRQLEWIQKSLLRQIHY